MQTIYNNGRVALTKDLIFGLCVMGETGWVAVDDLSKDDLFMIQKLVDRDPVFPWSAILYG